MHTNIRLIALVALSAAALAGCGPSPQYAQPVQYAQPPAVIVQQQPSGSSLLVPPLSHDCRVQISVTCVSEGADGDIPLGRNVLDSHHGFCQIRSRNRNIIE